MYLKSKVRRKASALVVPPDEVHVPRVLHLQRQKVQQHLTRKFSAVNVVPQKQVTWDTAEAGCVWKGGRARVSEHSQERMEW